MRPKDREQLFREGFDAYGAGDAGTVKGLEGFLEWARTWEEAWKRWDQDLREVRAAGERHVVARVHLTGRGRGSGVELALEIAHEREVSN